MICDKCSLNNKKCNNTAANGDIDCLIFARNYGYPRDSWTYYLAALNGHLDCLLYLFKKGCKQEIMFTSN